MIELFHYPTSRSGRLVWLLEELKAPYKLYVLDHYDQGYSKSPELSKVSEAAFVPTLIDGEIVISGSGASAAHLAEQYGKGNLGRFDDISIQAKYFNWMHFSEELLVPPLNQVARNSFVLPEQLRNEELLKLAHDEIERLFQLIDKHLAENEYLLGTKFSAADPMVGYTLYLAAFSMKLVDASMSNISRYLRTIETRPAFRRAAIDMGFELDWWLTQITRDKTTS